MEDSDIRFSLLLVDDEPTMLSFLKRAFLKNEYQVHTADNGAQALELLAEVKIDAALVDLNMPGMDGLTLLTAMHKDFPQVMVMMLSGCGSIQKAVEAVKLGAVDFLEKPFALEALRARIAQLQQLWRLREENRQLRSRIEFQFGFDRLVGNSTLMLKLKELIAQVGPNDAPVLIQGETGTGKELVARAIHHHSARSAGNFVPVDCAAITETVIESELFGHVKGAYTGAHTSTLGLLRSANGGTLFLDEVGELPPAIQSKLLRTIQENEVRPVGSNEVYSVDIRILAATNRDLAAEVALNNFREDLFYRLNVVAIDVPPLRERKEDLALLAKYFLKRFATDMTPAKDIARNTYYCLESHDWPGNIRELGNVIRRAIALGRNELIEPEDLPARIFTPFGDGHAPVDIPFGDSMASYEKSAILNALKKSGHNRKIAAQILGVGEATLYRKISKYGLKSKKQSMPEE